MFAFGQMMGFLGDYNAYQGGMAACFRSFTGPIFYPAAASPPPLDCTFSGADTPSPGWGYGSNGKYGYYMPIYLNYSATGGTGPYTWSNTQAVEATGKIAWSDGSSSEFSAPFANTEELANASDAPAGSLARFFDAPGLAIAKPGTSGVYVVSATIKWKFTLNASVSSGGRTKNCPTVSWSASLNWASVDGRANATGSATVP